VTLLVRIFLLMLLGLEWWDDPFHGGSLLSQHYSSQLALTNPQAASQMVLPVSSRAQVSRDCAGPNTCLALSIHHWEAGVEQHHAWTSAGDSLYVLMALRC
jgi:hypothetical protein